MKQYLVCPMREEKTSHFTHFNPWKWDFLKPLFSQNSRTLSYVWIFNMDFLKKRTWEERGCKETKIFFRTETLGILFCQKKSKTFLPFLMKKILKERKSSSFLKNQRIKFQHMMLENSESDICHFLKKWKKSDLNSMKYSYYK